MPPNNLEVVNLTKFYKNKLILDKICLSINQRQIVGLLGPNGAGKTTCFYAVLGLVKCNEGQINLYGQDVSQLPIHKRSQLGLGYLPQESSIFRQLSVENNILAILETRADLSRAQRYEILNDLLTEFDIQHIRKQKGIKLSGGERRRVEIARAIANNPKFILLDEPFAGIDPKAIVEIKNILRKLKQKLGILITDHNVRETLEICDKVYVLNNGQIMAEGTPAQILNNTLVKQTYLGESFTQNYTHDYLPA